MAELSRLLLEHADECEACAELDPQRMCFEGEVLLERTIKALAERAAPIPQEPS